MLTLSQNILKIYIFIAFGKVKNLVRNENYLINLIAWKWWHSILNVATFMVNMNGSIVIICTFHYSYKFVVMTMLYLVLMSLKSLMFDKTLYSHTIFTIQYIMWNMLMDLLAIALFWLYYCS